MSTGTDRPSRSKAPLRKDLSGRSVLAVRRGISADIPVRRLIVHLILMLILGAVSAWAMMQGERNLDLSGVYEALMGRGDRLDVYFVNQVRLPRVVTAIAVGSALGLSGAVFQVLSGNALGSPDIIGFTHGAATGALLQILVLDADPLGVAFGAILGGFGTALVVYLLTRHTGLRGYRLVLIGIGTGATLGAINSLLVVRASLTQAQTAASWLAGSLNTMNWSKTLLIATGLLALTPLLMKASRPLAMLRFGDQIAAGRGVRVNTWRVTGMFVGVLLVSLATAITGPLAFVALSAPHIGRTLAPSRGAGLITTALVGSVIVLCADVIGQYLLPVSLNAGVVTGALGGLYLVYLIIVERRRA
ncbi:FecCD family ABC transporter permease [Rothia uropygialis]|uniref:FecCD family ABC transporter permease n=1 Tax=Kocuria sp. 36 TaxID=1415402 RepID=UPI00101D8070|nr:iron chelate uptake ABC transporter family permease subunit [Kocuria sp. 36]